MEQIGTLVIGTLFMLLALSILAWMTGQLVGSKKGPLDFAKKVFELSFKGMGKLFLWLSTLFR